MHIVYKAKKVDGQLIPTSIQSKRQYDHFVSGLPEGQICETYLELITDNGSLGQLAKLHAMIRELAHFTGTTFEGMKLNVKEKAGLFTIINIEGRDVMHLKSFGDDCSKEQLSLAIQACIEIGETVNYILN